MTPCPSCGELFDATAHRQPDGYARCPNCDHQFLPDLEEVPTEDPAELVPDEALASEQPGGPPVAF